MASPEQILEIGIERLKMTREMAKLIKHAETTEDIRLILETMKNELDTGITEIDMLYSQNGE